MAAFVVLLVFGVLWLAYANGSNDNFKGVATLFGSGTTDYRRALTWATVTTLLGSLTAIVLAGTLLKNFSGKGLVDGALVGSVDYAAAVALGAALTVVVATRLGMPVSTTHSLVGALVGAGFAAGSTINLTKLAESFFLPLLVSPVVAITVTGLVYPVLRWTRRTLGITAQTCLCAGNEVLEVVRVSDYHVALKRAELLTVRIGDTVTCQNRYQGQLLGIEAAAALDWLHYLSAGMVSFGRGLNDTPKIAALLLLAGWHVHASVGQLASTALVGIAVALGGLLSARRVAETMSQKITTMNHGQGFAANLMMGLIVISASKLGMPVSTTHVSCGVLFGIGTVTRQAHWRMIGKILGAWVTTLPLAALLAAAVYLVAHL